MNSCRKGKVGEREWRDEVRKAGYDCIRGRQYSGSPDSPDVISKDLDFVHFEVKRTEGLSLYEAMAQAVNDAGEKLPVVAHRRNGKDWLCIMSAETFFKLIKHEAFIRKHNTYE